MDIREALLTIRYHQEGVLDQIAQRLNISFEDFLKSHTPYLSQSQIRSLIDQGFYFGGHSVDHPMFSDLTLEEQIHQTKQSVAYVVETFDLKYRAFAFPFTDYGVSKSFFNRIQAKGIVDLSFGCAGQKEDEGEKKLPAYSL